MSRPNVSTENEVRPVADDGPSLLPLLVVALAVVGVVAVMSLDTAAGDLRDTDGYMRVLRVTDLVEHPSSWYDGSAPRSNAPFGHSMHWTRPMDVLLVALSLPTVAVLGSSQAVYWAGVVAGPLLLVGIGLTVSWAARPLLGRWAPIAGLTGAASPVVGVYSDAGRADHHALILLLVAGAVGAFIRVVSDAGGSSRYAVATGVVSAVGLWTSTEFLLVVGLFAVFGAVLWMKDGESRIAAHLQLWVAFLVGTSVALVVERPPSELLLHEVDRVSVVHVAVAFVGCGFWWATTLLPGRWTRSVVRRACAGLLLAAVAASILWLFDPVFFEGPFGAVPERVREVWLQHVVELHPLLGAVGPDEMVPWVVGALLIPVLGLVGAIAAARSDRRRSSAWWFLALMIGVSAAVAIVQVRWLPYPQMIGSIPLVWLAAPMLRAAWRLRSPQRVVAVVVVASVLAFGWRVPVWALSQIAPEGQAGEEVAACSIPDLASALDGVAEPGAPVLAAVDIGPELLYRSHVDVVASPYHRNVSGILDSFDSLGATDPVALKNVVERRGVDFVAVCPDFDDRYFGENPDSNYRRLVDGGTLGFLERADLGDTGGFLVFSVSGA